MKVTFLRHCRSIFNELKTSEKDCDLSEFGKEQATGLHGKWDIIVCSIMKRTRKTLELSKLEGEKIFYSDLCREVKRDICEEERFVATGGHFLLGGLGGNSAQGFATISGLFLAKSPKAAP